MDNFTPLKIGKKKSNRFLILGNILLLIIVVGVTGFYFKDKLFTNQQKAAVIPTSIPTVTPTITRTLSMSNSPTPTLVTLLTPTATPTLKPTIRPILTNTPAPTLTNNPTATPTEIIIAKTSISPTTIANLPETGTIKSFVYIIPGLIMLIGLIL